MPHDTPLPPQIQGEGFYQCYACTAYGHEMSEADAIARVSFLRSIFDAPTVHAILSQAIRTEWRPPTIDTLLSYAPQAGSTRPVIDRKHEA